jgi:hypothetical protein
MKARRRTAAAAALAATVMVAAACGSTHASPGLADSAAPAASLPLATSLAGPGLPGWAVVQMGGSSKDYENFWELFARPAGSAQWKLATPLGVASNGGLVISASGAGLVAGFRPSQDLTFSPLAAAASPAAAWSQGSALVSPGLADVPDALAAGPAGQVLALTRTGAVLLGSHGGANWTRLTTLRSATNSAAGRACGLTALTAVAFSTSGIPLLAGTCARQGRVGIFSSQRSTTVQAAVPARPAGPVTVLGLATQAGGTTALIQAGTGKAATVTAAWSATGTGSWRVSAAVPTDGGPISEAIWAGGSAALVLAGGHGAVIAGEGASWRALPALPARTATLALGSAGQLEALTAAGNTLAVWQLGTDSRSWSRLMQVRVTIPYGSSS